MSSASETILTAIRAGEYATALQWDGLGDSTTHGQDDGGQDREAAKRAKASGRQQKTISVIDGSGRHPGHQSSSRGPGQDRVPSPGRGRQGMARSTSCAEKERGGLRPQAVGQRDGINPKPTEPQVDSVKILSENSPIVCASADGFAWLA
jgi:hypothetical protein